VLAFVVRRVLWTIPILFVVVTITFFMLRSIGGDPFSAGPVVGLGNPAWSKVNDRPPESIRSNLERKYALDLPWYEQYANYLQGIVTLDLGPSLTYRERSVREIIAELAPQSLELGFLALCWMVVVGVPVGVLSALRAGSHVDGAARIGTALAIVIPNFAVATFLIYVFAVELDLLPSSGWEGWQAKVLPSITLALLPAAFTARLVRAATLETLQADYVRAARAKGLRRRTVVARHVLRNSLGPALNNAGPAIAFLLTGTFVVEEVFAIPGLGRFYVVAALARDYTLLLGLTVLFAVAVVLANLAVDVAQALLDPRHRGRSA
jgi:oligopeptide transport system permease protein